MLRQRNPSLGSSLGQHWSPAHQPVRTGYSFWLVSPGGTCREPPSKPIEAGPAQQSIEQLPYHKGTLGPPPFSQSPLRTVTRRSATPSYFSTTIVTIVLSIGRLFIITSRQLLRADVEAYIHTAHCWLLPTFPTPLLPIHSSAHLPFFFLLSRRLPHNTQFPCARR